MAQDNLYKPFRTGEDQKVRAEVDRTDVTSTDRVGSRVGYPSLAWGVELATGLFDRLRANFIGLDPDGFRVGELVVGVSSSVTNILAAIFNEGAESNANLELTNSLLSGLSSKATASARQALSDPMMRKLAAIDAGAVTVAATGFTANFTGVNLVGRAVVAIEATTGRRIQINNIVDPAGANPGTLTFAEQVYAGTVLVVPYLTTPHAWNSAADAYQSLAVVGDPPRINGPATFLAISAAVIGNGTTQYILPCALYGRQQIQIVWFCLGTSTLQFRSYRKIDNAAWAAAGAIPAGYSCDSWWQYTPGSVVFGAPPIGGGAAATPNILEARLQDPGGADSIAIEMVATNTGGNSTVTGTIRLTGGTA